MSSALLRCDVNVLSAEKIDLLALIMPNKEVRLSMYVYAPVIDGQEEALLRSMVSKHTDSHKQMYVQQQTK